MRLVVNFPFYASITEKKKSIFIKRLQWRSRKSEEKCGTDWEWELCGRSGFSPRWPASRTPPSVSRSPGWRPAPCRYGWQLSRPERESSNSWFTQIHAARTFTQRWRYVTMTAFHVCHLIYSITKGTLAHSVCAPSSSIHRKITTWNVEKWGDTSSPVLRRRRRGRSRTRRSWWPSRQVWVCSRYLKVQKQCWALLLYYFKIVLAKVWKNDPQGRKAEQTFDSFLLHFILKSHFVRFKKHFLNNIFIKYLKIWYSLVWQYCIDAGTLNISLKN